MASVIQKLLLYKYSPKQTSWGKNIMLERDQIMSVTGQGTPNKVS